MKGQTVTVRLDKNLAALLEEVSAEDGQEPSSLLRTSAGTFLAMSTHARKLIRDMEQNGTEREREFLADCASQAILSAIITIVEDRNIPRLREEDRRNRKNTELVTEEEIAAEAVRLCHM